MATHIGRDGIVYAGTDAVAEMKDWSIEESAEVVSTTVMGDEWTKSKVTQKSWTASFNAFWDGSDNGQAALAIGSTITVKFQPQGDTTGLEEWTGTAIINQVSKSGDMAGIIEASFSVTGVGALTYGSVPA